MIQLCLACYLLNIAVNTRMGIVEKYNVSPIFLGINMATRISQSLLVFVVPMETIMKRNTEQKIIDAFKRIDEIFRINLTYNIDYRTHWRRQIVKTWLCYIVTTIVFVSNFFVPTTIYEPGNFAFSCTFIVSRLRVYQFAFYVNAVRDNLDELKQLMRIQHQRVKYNSTRWKDIQYIRKIYSKIWLLKTLIGERFGYSIILLVIDLMIKMMTSVYWTYMNFNSIQSISLHWS